MAKPKNPILSLGARGTIGDTLTFQKRGQDTVARKKPIPKDPYSLPQAYQRWDHTDYAYLWTLESEASKQTYRTRASRYHITGFNLWMKEHLRDLPDLAGRWHLDERTGIFVHDTSRNNNTGTIFGATPASGLIDNAYHFDGINDRIVIANHSTLQLTQAITIEAFIYPQTFPPLWAWKEILDKQAYVDYRLGIFQDAGGQTYLQTIIGNTWLRDTLNPLTLNTWYHVAVTFDSANIKLYLDGTLINQTPRTDPMGTGSVDIFIASYPGLSEWWHGTIDQVIIYNRALDATEVQRHSQRRYPP